MNYNNHNESEKRRVVGEKLSNSNASKLPKLPDGRTVAAETVRVLKSVSASCGSCHYFCSVLSPASGRTSEDGSGAATVTRTVCRLKKHKEVKYYNICELYKKLSITELKQESS